MFYYHVTVSRQVKIGGGAPLNAAEPAPGRHACAATRRYRSQLALSSFIQCGVGVDVSEHPISQARKTK